jgi:hypothetical protein
MDKSIRQAFAGRNISDIESAALPARSGEAK